MPTQMPKKGRDFSTAPYTTASYASEDINSALQEGNAPSPGSTNRSAAEMIFGSLVTTTEPKLFKAVIFSNAFCAE